MIGLVLAWGVIGVFFGVSLGSSDDRVFGLICIALASVAWFVVRLAHDSRTNARASVALERNTRALNREAVPDFTKDNDAATAATAPRHDSNQEVSL